MKPRKVQQIFQRLRAANPSPATELKYTTPFQLLVAIMLSAQATDKSVNKATQRLFEIAATPSDMIALGETGLKKYIKSIGLYNTKAHNIVNTSRILLEWHNGEVPNNRAALETLPGVGRKTANVILNTLFKQPTIAVDTHIFRVANRIGLARGKTVLEVEKILDLVVPDEFKHDAHHWLILHGRYVCLARKPHCSECLIADLCEYEKKNY